MRHFTVITLGALIFTLFLMSSCSKEDEPVRHYFNYKFNSKAGGSTGQNSMSLANMFFLDNGFTAQTDNGSLVIYAAMGSGCNEPGKPACYDATIVVPGIVPGTYTLGLGKAGNMLVAEFNSSGIEQYSCDGSSPASDNITVTISEVGTMGGIVAGSFSGTIGGVSVSGDFKVERLS